jgi:hypothetical protein
LSDAADIVLQQSTVIKGLKEVNDFEIWICDGDIYRFTLMLVQMTRPQFPDNFNSMPRIKMREIPFSD